MSENENPLEQPKEPEKKHEEPKQPLSQQPKSQQPKPSVGFDPTFEPKKDIDVDALSKLIKKELGIPENAPVPMVLVVWRGPDSARFRFFPMGLDKAWISQYDSMSNFFRDLANFTREGQWAEDAMRRMQQQSQMQKTFNPQIRGKGPPGGLVFGQG